MADVLVAPEFAVLLLAGLLLTAVAGQTLAWQTIHTRYGRRLFHGGHRRLVEGAVVVFLILQVLAFGNTLGRSSDSYFEAGALAWRWAAWGLLLVAVVAGRRLLRSGDGPVLVALTALTLPIADPLPAFVPYGLLIVVLFYLIARAAAVTVGHYRQTTRGVSALSVQEAIDRLPSGLMFVQANHAVALINTRMRSVMSDLTGRVYRHGEDFLGQLADRTGNPRAVRQLDEAPVFRLKDGTYWMLRRSEVTVEDRTYQELVAVDITLRWQLIHELTKTHERLERANTQLRAEFDSMVAACTADELLRARTRVHDVIGQRASMMLRLLRSEQVTDRRMLVELADGMREELAFGRVERTAAQELELLRTALAGIGVELVGPGWLPNDEDISQLVADIVRESTSNAIRHGSATRIVAELESTREKHLLSIRNNGVAGTGEIVEGGGLGGMRYRLERVGGELSIRTTPEFVVRATIPKSTT